MSRPSPWRRAGGSLNRVFFGSKPGRRHPTTERFARNHSLSFELLEPRIALSGAPADDVPNYFYQAAPLTLTGAGAATRDGTIERAGDVDMFRFTAAVTGRMTVTQTARLGSGLDSYLNVYNSSQGLLAGNDDSGGTVNSRVAINVVAGRTYYVRAAAYGNSTGAYRLGFGTAPTDDVGNTFAAASTLTLSSAGAASRNATVNYAGDADVFRVVATVSGQMTIRQSAASGSRLDSFLYVYSSSQSLLAQNDDSGGTLNSQVTVAVTAGSAYYVKAAAYGTTTGAYVLQVSTTADTPPGPGDPPPAPGNFQITLSLSGLTTQQQTLARQAAARWESVIVGDLPDVVYQGRTIDDVLVNVSGQAIDGAGGILGQAGPQAYRTGSYLPVAGVVILDTADMAQMQAQNRLLDVLTHEIGHVLGFGIFWQQKGLLSGAGTADPRFTGARATAEYNALFGVHESGVPVEATGGQGTALAHWRESTFRTELMTGWNDAAPNAMSRVTVASMADIGYQVNMAAAEAFSRPAVRSSVAYVTAAQTIAAVLASGSPSHQLMRAAGSDGASPAGSALVFNTHRSLVPIDNAAGLRPSASGINTLLTSGERISQTSDFRVSPSSVDQVLASAMAREWLLPVRESSSGRRLTTESEDNASDDRATGVDDNGWQDSLRPSDRDGSDPRLADLALEAETAAVAG